MKVAVVEVTIVEAVLIENCRLSCIPGPIYFNTEEERRQFFIKREQARKAQQFPEQAHKATETEKHIAQLEERIDGLGHTNAMQSRHIATLQRRIEALENDQRSDCKATDVAPGPNANPNKPSAFQGRMLWPSFRKDTTGD